jgi:FdhD protein
MREQPVHRIPTAPSSISHPTRKWRGGHFVSVNDHLCVEEPLEIRMAGRPFTVTMRTPGHDEEVTAGFLLAEGFVNSIDEIDEIRRIPDRKGAPEPNVMDVILKVPSEKLRERSRRNFVMASSCGLCGKTSIESLKRRVPVLSSSKQIASQVLITLAPKLRNAQEVFAATGGLHAAGLFDLNGRLRVSREDIGRHNAVDKVIGHQLLNRAIPAEDSVLMVSGRSSFEIVQKAAVAGIAILAAVSAPSSLAVELADELGMTLIGFLRDEDFNVYSHAFRVC